MSAPPAVGRRTLLELRAALQAGASPAGALAAAGSDDPALGSLSRAVRLGSGLADAVATAPPHDPTTALLARALAVAEAGGAGAGRAVEQALTAVREDLSLRRLLAVRTAQARATAKVLAALPVVCWVLLVALDGTAIRFYVTPLGIATALAAAGLATASWWVMSRMVRRAEKAADRNDPLPGGGGAETVELVAVGLAAGMSPLGALGACAGLAPEAARELLRAAVAGLGAGTTLDDALRDTPLADLGATLAACERWGAPAQPALRDLADDLRADRRAGAEEAAERLQVALVFPTTLLTLPAFVLGVVPPLLWATLRI